MRGGTERRRGLGLRFSALGLEAGATFRDAPIRTEGARAEIMILTYLPDTVMTCLVGRAVGDLVDLPALADPSYRVTAVEDLSDGKGARRGWRVEVAVPRVGWRAPWARGGAR